MAWTTPKTWAAELLTSTDLNTQVRDNLNALKTPPTDSYIANEVSDYTTTSTSFVDVDATNLSLTITTTGGDVLIGFVGVARHSNNLGIIHLDVYESVGNARLGGDDGILGINAVSSQSVPLSLSWLATGLSAGSHTFKLQWKTFTGTATMYAGAGTLSLDTHPQFWVREI